MNTRKTKTPTAPPRILVYGPHKIGKSTFAAQAPAPIFIQTEDGLDAIDADAMPLCGAWGDILAHVTALYEQEHAYKTVVLDSVDWAERLAHQQVAENNGVKGIEGIGYGKGYVFAADLFNELLLGLNALREHKGMAVILIAHAEIRRFDDPLADAYDRYQIKCNKLVAKMVQEWADVIGFAQLDAVTKTEDSKAGTKRTRAVTTGQRVLRLEGSPSFDAGNRYGLPATLPLVWGEFETALAAARA